MTETPTRTVDVLTGYDRWSLDYDAFPNPMVALEGTGFHVERVLEMRADAHAAEIPKLARHGSRNAVCALRAVAHAS